MDIRLTTGRTTEVAEGRNSRLLWRNSYTQTSNKDYSRELTGYLFNKETVTVCDASLVLLFISTSFFSLNVVL